MHKAAAYLRSSKDRHDVSLSAQLAELQELASSRGAEIIRTYDDPVQRGSTDQRPAFLELVADIKNKARGWSLLLIYDTARLARGEQAKYIAQCFRHECRRHGVELVIKRVPDTDPISKVIIECMFEAMDIVTSMMSRQRGLAGMRENIRRGYRAGGRAPWGFHLEHIATGAIRDGKPVTKSKLVPSSDADAAAKYLSLRAGGVPRAECARQLGITLKPNSLIGIEWNALTYAGHTIWNRHTPKDDRGNGRNKRRDRTDWVIQPNTHTALITEAEAEAIIAQLETSDIGRAVSAAKCARGDYLLSGVLETSAGDRWIGAGDHYRLKPTAGRRGRRARRETLERAILERIRWDLQSKSIVDAIVEAAKAANDAPVPKAPIDAEIAKRIRQRDRAARLSLEYEGEAYAQLVADLDRQITALRREADAAAAERHANETLSHITPADVRAAIASIDSDRALITGLVGRVVLDPDLTQARIDYGLNVASPRVRDRWAEPVYSSIVKLVA
jgi:site-specific DNA recombinase